MTVCEIRGVPAAVCIVYLSSLSLEAGTIKAYFDFLQSFPSTRSIKFQSGKPSVDASAKTGNLYI